MGDIIITDDLGRSMRFTPTDQGYRDAQTEINALRQQGRIVSGDVGRVEGYTGGDSSRPGIFRWF